MLMSQADTALLVIDIQDKLVNLIENGPLILWNARRLVDAARLMEIPVLGTVQYPKGLGPMTPKLADGIDRMAEKTRFSCAGCPEVFDGLLKKGIHKIAITGIETHVCVLQTALDLLTAGFDVFVCVDAVGARFPVDHRIGLRRIEANGGTLTTTESAVFEWCEDAKSAPFKQISQLIRQPAPTKTLQKKKK